MTPAEFIALLLFAAATFTPGPNTTLSTALAANRGLRGALHFVCAVPAGWVLLLCGVGLGTLVMAAPALRWGILVVGVAYMLRLAARLARLGRTPVLMEVFGFTSNFTCALVGSLLRHWVVRGRCLLWFNRSMALVVVRTAWASTPPVAGAGA